MRSAPFTSSRPTTGSRSRTVQVLAKKGQKGRSGVIPGQGEMIRVSTADDDVPITLLLPNVWLRLVPPSLGQNEPPVPEVDPDNVEFVIFLRAKNVRSGRSDVRFSYLMA